MNVNAPIGGDFGKGLNYDVVTNGLNTTITAAVEPKNPKEADLGQFVKNVNEKKHKGKNRKNKMADLTKLVFIDPQHVYLGP